MHIRIVQSETPMRRRPAWSETAAGPCVVRPCGVGPRARWMWVSHRRHLFRARPERRAHPEEARTLLFPTSEGMEVGNSSAGGWGVPDTFGSAARVLRRSDGLGGGVHGPEVTENESKVLGSLFVSMSNCREDPVARRKAHPDGGVHPVGCVEVGDEIGHGDRRDSETLGQLPQIHADGSGPLAVEHFAYGCCGH